VVQLNAIVIAIQQLVIATGNQGQGGSDNSQCCAQIVAAIAAVVAQLTSIANVIINMPGGGGGTIDLTTVVVALDAIAIAIANQKTTVTLDTGPIDDDLKAIAKAIAEGPGTDLSFLRKLVEHQPETDAIVSAIVNRMIADGVIDSDLGQQLLS